MCIRDRNHRQRAARRIGGGDGGGDRHRHIHKVGQRFRGIQGLSLIHISVANNIPLIAYRAKIAVAAGMIRQLSRQPGAEFPFVKDVYKRQICLVMIRLIKVFFF